MIDVGRKKFVLPVSITVVIILFTFTICHGYYGARHEPPDGTIYHGCGWNGYNSQANYSTMFPSSHHPLILQVVADMPGTRYFDVPHLIQALTSPIVHSDSQYIEYGLHFRNRDGMLDSVFALTTTMDHYIDTLVAAFLAVNRPFFLRIGFEFNGNWNPYHPYIFPLAFRKLVTELRARGINNFASVWCYEPDAPPDFADSSALGWKWYPGDDVVDWFGLDPFDMEHFNPALPDSFLGQLTKKGRSEAFLRFAQQRRKPVYQNELSARHVYIVHDSLDPTQQEGQLDYEYWFVPFFQFVRNHPDIKGWNYINLDWTRYPTYQTWGDARLEINTHIRTRWVDTLMAPRFLNVGYDITQSAHINELELTTSKIKSNKIFVNQLTHKITLNTPGKLLDVTGRKIIDLHLGENDIKHLTPGVYFISQNTTNRIFKILVIK